MPEVVKVAFKRGGKAYYFSTNDLDLATGEHVIVRTESGDELGKVVSKAFDIPESELNAPLKEVMRLATEEDLEQKKRNIQTEKELFYKCKKKIKENNLDMKLVGAEMAFDGKKIIFSFTAEERIDFRQLVKDLSADIRKKVELRQIGVRDAARCLGGFGVCGMYMCCTSFGSDFDSVSIKMAKDQGLPLNPNKISGTCGRLMCCLKYEHEVYKDFCKCAPAVGQTVKTPQGLATVSSYAVPKGTVVVSFENGISQEFLLSEVTVTKKR